MSTRAEASEVSGRGVGLAALREAVRALGGTMEVVSTRGGTSLISTFPFADLQPVSLDPPSQPMRRLG
jgi:chemotaxis protein histidine kinase CheA